MKKLIFLFAVALSFLASSQQTVSIHNTVPNLPEGTYFKDINNEFDKFVGVWSATFQNKIILIDIVKAYHEPIRLEKNYFTDQVVVRFEVKTNTGQVLYSTLNNNFSSNKKHMIEGIFFADNGQTVRSVYRGGDCNAGIGLISLQKIDSAHLKYNYEPGGIVVDDITCPQPRDLTIYLPEVPDLIFTKQ